MKKQFLAFDRITFKFGKWSTLILRENLSEYFGFRLYTSIAFLEGK